MFETQRLRGFEMSEKLCLQWNNFQENIKNAFGNFREDNDFADVTLASEDGQQVEAHKVILAASSPTFQKLLGRNKHPHPLIYLRGIKAQDLMAILDFLYRGKANVFQDNVDSFLAVAEDLQIKGLMGKTEERLAYFGENKRPSYSPSENYPKNSSMRQMSSKESHNPPEENLVIPPNLSGNFNELEEKVNSLMEKSQNKTADGRQLAYRCTLCGKEGHCINIKYHIEANHLQGVVIPCNFCGKIFSSRHALKLHTPKCHLRSNI